MINKKQSRLRRARATRARILLQKVDRLTVHRTNLHIYASIISADNGRTLVSASTVELQSKQHHFLQLLLVLLQNVFLFRSSLSVPDP